MTLSFQKEPSNHKLGFYVKNCDLQVRDTRTHTHTHTHTHKQTHPPAHIYSKNTGAILIASVNTFFNHIKTLSNNYHIHPRLVLVVSNTFLCDCVKLTEHSLSREFKWSEINKHHNYTPCREREIWWRHRYVYLPLCPLDNNYQPI